MSGFSRNSIVLLLWFLYLSPELTLPFGKADDVQPLHYNLSLLTEVNGTEMKGNFSGNLTIQLLVLQETKTIVLSVDKLNVSHKIVMIRNNNSDQETVRLVVPMERQRRTVIEFESELHEEENYTLSLEFWGRLTNTSNSGYFLVSYGNGSEWIALTELAPNLAGSVFPCFEDLGLVTPFELHLAHKNDTNALSNMPVNTTSPHEREGYVWTSFEISPINVHKLAFTIHALTPLKAPGPANGPEMVYWVRPNVSEQTAYAIGLASKFLAELTTLIGSPYPVKKIDQLVLPGDIQQSNEYLGLVYLPESMFLYSEENWTLEDKQVVTIYMANVLTHHWLCNLVSYRLYWITAGLSDYFIGFVLDRIEPGVLRQEQVMMQTVIIVLQEDSQASSLPLGLAQSGPAVTGKTSLLFRMLKFLMGPQVFQESMQLYLKQEGSGGGNKTDMWQTFQQQCDKQQDWPKDVPVQEMMNSWTLQPGYPVIYVKRNYATGQVTITQKRFLKNPSVKAVAKRRQCWWVPLTFTTASKAQMEPTKADKWLKCGGNGTAQPQIGKPYEAKPEELSDVAKPDEWVLFNLGHSVPCRVVYDEQNWQLLVAELKGNASRFDGPSRAQILDDALNLATAGLVKYDVAFSFLQELPRENDSTVWQAAATNLQSLNQILRNTSIFSAFKSFLHSLLEAKFGELFPKPEESKAESKAESNAESPPKESGKNTELKRIVLQLSCQMQLGSCEKQALKDFAGLNETSNPIPKDQRETVYCTAARLGTQANRTFLEKLYKQSKDAGERRIILAGLACSQDKGTLKNVLKWVFTSGDMPKEDVLHVFKVMVQNPKGYTPAKDYLMANIKQIIKFFNNSMEELSQLLAVLFKEISTKAELDSVLKSIKSKLKNLRGIESASRRLSELAQDNIAWLKDQYKGAKSAICTITGSSGKKC